jgi:taurine dioxygenase
MSLREPTMMTDGFGARWRVADLAALAGDPDALEGLRSLLDERLVVEIGLETPAKPENFVALQHFLGEPEYRRSGPMIVPGTDFLVDFSTEGKPDDGRPRAPAFIESLHYDTMANGPAAYGVHCSRLGQSAAPMRFVDMRAVYNDLSEATRAKLRGARTRHTARQRPPPELTPWSMQPLVIAHPRTGAPLLLLPNRRDSRIEGLEDPEGIALISALWEDVGSRPGVEINLMPHTLVVWDNIACVHTNPAFPRDKDHSVWFFNVVNNGPIAALTA